MSEKLRKDRVVYKDFEIKKDSVTAITGSGGKTSLMLALAKELAEEGKVLVTTTTKIYKPLSEEYENLFLAETGEIIKGRGKNIDVLGGKIKEGKLISPLEDEILKRKSDYDYIIYEADGAKEKIMKFWENYEPCILSFTDTVIGVGNIKSLGMKFNEENVHRFNMYMDSNNKHFSKKYIDEEILKDYLKEGDFFRDFKGKKIRFLNGVESDEEIRIAMEFAEEIPDFVFGSVREKKIYTPRQISAIIMGSGESKRFGKNKLLCEVEGVPMIERVIRNVASLPFKKIFVTYKDEEVLKICKKYNVIPLKNERYYLGQSESIKLGVRNTENEGMMFFTGDMPFLTKEIIGKLMGEFYRENIITIPRVKGQRFSPVIFPAKYKFPLLSLSGDTGGREIIKTEKEIKFVEFEEKDIRKFMDIDTKEELENIEGEKNDRQQR